MIALDLKKAKLKILYIFEYFMASSDYISEHQDIFQRINLSNPGLFHHVKQSGSMLEII